MKSAISTDTEGFKKKIEDQAQVQPEDGFGELKHVDSAELENLDVPGMIKKLKEELVAR